MCTGVRFSDDEGNTYFGRNLDWSFSYGRPSWPLRAATTTTTVFGAGGARRSRTR